MKKIIIVGHSGSGKDYLLSGLLKYGYKNALKITTRPIREGEVDGINYKYTNDEEFEKMISEGKIKCYQKFFIKKDVIWYYGFLTEDFANNDIFIMTPFEVEHLSDEDLEQSIILFINIEENIRRKRIAKRNDNNDDINRRIEADKLDFKGFTKYDIEITDETFNIDHIYTTYCKQKESI